ncbi:MAG: sigma-54-dependent Fis family transcriptional regulator [Deltaproteobacteria bacterium]|nr:sigma-54-dependent Fis family transcriptional regulator [Deltaproteobacteria bacterium]
MSESAPPQSPRVLVVDDEKNIRRTLKMVLEAEGYDVWTAESAEQALTQIEADRPDCVVMDVKLPKMDGVAALAKIREQWNEDVVPIIMISGHASMSDAVRATKLGAFDFFEKPLDRNRILVSIRNAVQHVQMAQEVQELRSSLGERFELVGQSPPMLQLFRTIEKVAPTKGRVLITGESGTGKELVARAIHRNSDLADRPFVKVNCAAISPELIESELFGHERGAFTGAVARRRGLFEVANGGTIFLDEVGDMSLSAQAKVLRVLQTGEFVRVGGERVVRVDVRVLAATNKDLQEAIQANLFREDLYFRLNVIPIRTPALREHRTDIPLLVIRFVEEFCRQNGFRTKTVEPKAMDGLTAYPWPGNVRELKNVIERVVILSDETITVDDLPDFLADRTIGRVNLDHYTDRTLREFREEMERAFVLLKLNEFEWNISRTATALGVERTNLHKKIKALGLKRNQQ